MKERIHADTGTVFRIGRSAVAATGHRHDTGPDSASLAAGTGGTILRGSVRIHRDRISADRVRSADDNAALLVSAGPHRADTDCDRGDATRSTARSDQ